MIKNKTGLLFKWLSREKRVIYNIYILALLQGALYLAIPLSVQGIITYIMAGRFSASLILLCTLTVLITVFIGLLQLAQMRLNENLHERIFCTLTERIAKSVNENKIIKQKLTHFFEVVTLQKGIGKILMEFSFSIISILLGLLLLPAYSTWFLIFSVVLGFFFYLTITYYGKKAQEANVNTSTQKYQVFDLLTNGNENSNQIDSALNLYIDYRKEYYDTFEKQYKGILFFKIFFIAILLFIGAYLVQIGELNIGQFVASEIIILLVINSVEKLVGSIGTFYDIITGLYKLELIFANNPDESYLESQEVNYFEVTGKVYRRYYTKKTRWLFYSILVACIVILFLPWTQTVRLEGEVSVLNPENKPQQITSRIAGRLEKWFIKDGAFVKKNDTIAFISEIKEEYMDSQLVQRVESQVKAKKVSIQAYESKVSAIEQQIEAINRSLHLKTEQTKNKIAQVKAKLTSDIADAESSLNNYTVAEEQFKRYEELLEKGIISKTDLENRKIKVQESYSKKIASENKVNTTKNELTNTELELNSTFQEYNEKVRKAESDKFSTISLLYEAQGELMKLQNQLSNYSLRNTYYFVLAPQDGFINNLALKGIGEIVKEGGMICNIVPPQKEQAVALYVDPIDLPLIAKGQSIQLVFDGWPAFVFSGWPGLSYGSFNAEIVAFDKVISPNGKFRVLAVNKSKPWPYAVHIGGGVKGYALLKNVPVIYELWRKANGFPPEFYKRSEIDETSKSYKK
ncbi:MAG TPA: biotin/lipoyl-binding protein [Bacteroidia bacterium]|nr:biotin/lipoyl-binding protein [Bacteroidia bacterium]